MTEFPDIIEFVLDYLKDEKRYAIAIEGPWGSGKTRFVENDLRSALKKPSSNDGRAYRLRRVSLFGVKDVQELCARFLTVGVKEGTGSDQKKTIAAIFNPLFKQAPRLFSEVISNKMGVNLSISPEIFARLFLLKDCLYVFDDAERLSSGDDEFCIFGFINDLIEEQGAKVLFVTKDINEVDYGIREKLIWKIKKFSPDPNRLSHSFFEFLEGRIGDKEIVHLIGEAACRASCRNARAMMKASPLIEMFAKCPQLYDEDRSVRSRQNALVEATSLALLAAEGHEPQAPERDGGGVGSLGVLDNAQKQIAYEHYLSLRVVSSYFSSDWREGQEEVDASFGWFMDECYSESEANAKLDMALGEVDQITAMDDLDADQAVRQFMVIIQDAEFEPSRIAKVVSKAAQLRGVGYQEECAAELVLEKMKKLIDRNIESAFNQFHKPYADHMLAFFDNDNETLQQLDAYCVQRYKEVTCENCCQCSQAGYQALEEWIRKAVFRKSEVDYGALMSINPELFADFFKEGTVSAQLLVHEIIQSIESKFYTAGQYGEEMRDWLERFRTNLNDKEINGRMSRLRRIWVMEDIGKIVEKCK